MNNLQVMVYEGHLAADPVMRYLADGTAVTNIRIGSNRSYKNSAGKKIEEVTWLKIATWGKRAEFVNQYTKKGTRVIITGRLKPNKDGSPDTYELRNGETVASFEMTVRDIEIVSGGNFDKPAAGESEQEDDLPY